MTKLLTKKDLKKLKSLGGIEIRAVPNLHEKPLGWRMIFAVLVCIVQGGGKFNNVHYCTYFNASQIL